MIEEAGKVCDGTFKPEAIEEARKTVMGLPKETKSEQATRAAKGVLIEQHLLDLMEKFEKADDEERPPNDEKRSELRYAIAEVFQPGKTYNWLSVSAAYKALKFYVERVDTSLELVQFVGMANEFARTERVDDAPPVTPISKSSTNAASAPDSLQDPVAHIDRPEARKQKTPTPYLKAAVLRVSRQTKTPRRFGRHG